MSKNLSFQTHILLVEDDPSLRESIAEYFRREDYEVTAVDRGLQFFNAIKEQSFAVAIIDLGLPDIDGMRLVEYLRNNTDTRCIVLTARDTLDDRVSGYEAGADLYLVKPIDCRELASALGRMVMRKASDRAQGTPCRAWKLDSHNASLVAPNRSVVVLTSKEFAFLRCLANGAEDAVSRAKIMDSLGYQPGELAHRALESLVRRLRRKIEQSTSDSPILTCHGIGYAFCVPLQIV